MITKVLELVNTDLDTLLVKDKQLYFSTLASLLGSKNRITTGYDFNLLALADRVNSVLMLEGITYTNRDLLRIILSNIDRKILITKLRGS